MRIDEFITSLRKDNNIYISVHDGDLRIKASKKDLSQKLVAEIKDRKKEILEFFENAHSPENSLDIKKTEKKDWYHLSFAQKRLYFLYELDKTSLAYNVNQLVKIDEPYDKEKLSNVLVQLTRRHNSLRTYFDLKEGEPIQRIADDVTIEIEHYELGDDTEEAIYEKFIRPFDLSKAPLFRVGVIESNSDQITLLIDVHHIISDGLSLAILSDDFFHLYQGKELEPLTIQYTDYAEWQNEPDQIIRIAKDEQYWIKELQGQLPVLKLPTDYPRLENNSDKGGNVGTFLSPKENELIGSYCSRHNITKSMLFYSLFSMLMSKLSGQQDIIVGLSIAGRDHRELENMVGMFVNALPIRTAPKNEHLWTEFVQEVKKTMLLGHEHQSCPFDSLVEKLNVKRNSGRNPIFDVMLNYGGKMDRKLELADSEYGKFKHTSGTKRFDLTLNVGEYTDTIYLQIQYDSSLFLPETSERILKCFINLITSLESLNERRLIDINIASSEDINKVNDQLEVYESNTPISDLEPASYHQERLWFIDKFEGGNLYEGSPVYHNIPLVIDFNGVIDTTMLETSIKTLISKYDILRTVIINNDEIPYQKAIDDCNFSLTIEDKTGQNFDKKDLIQRETNKPFELDKLLVRATIYQLDSEKSTLIITFHHIVVDRYSTNYLAKELLSIYNLSTEDRAMESSSKVSYSAFSKWQKESLSSLETYLLSYWKLQLGEKLKALELPTDRIRRPIHTYTGASLNVSIPQKLAQEVFKLENQSGISAEVILMAAFKVLLFKYCKHEEIVIGTSVDNRNISSLEGVIGPISNLVVVKSQILPDTCFENFLQVLNETYSRGLNYQAMPFDKLVKELAPKKDMSRTALFDVLFQYVNDKTALPELEGVNVEIIDTNLGYGKYDLNLFMQNTDDGIIGNLVYNSDYLNKSTMENFLSHYYELLGNVLDQPKLNISEVDIIPAKERALLLAEFDNIEVAYPEDKTILDIFAESVSKYPKNVAVEYENDNISYEDLDHQSTKAAIMLRNNGVKVEDVVGLFMDRGIATIVGMLAILKSGGAYLPIDIDFPKERTDYIIENSETKIILTNKEAVKKLDSKVSTIFIEDAEQIPDEEATIEYLNKPSDLCYVIYTSGTTGKPKGVMVEHYNVVRLLLNEGFQFDFGSNDVWTMFHSHCFDFSVWEMYGALFYGAKLVVVPKAKAVDTLAFADILKQQKVTVLNQTPSAFYSLIQYIDDLELDFVRYVIFAGEALNPGKLKKWRTKYPDIKLINMYGITETTVHSSYKEIGEYEIENNISNIGKALPTLSLYLFDENMKPVPRGVSGELYVGGAGVTRGYLRNKELTDQRYLTNPYSPHERLYRSGDLARVLESSELEYIGRMDNQIQLRGFRIELGEIEMQLLKCEQVNEVVVIAKEEEESYLIAYYVSDEVLDSAYLRNYLLERLPDYMVPGYFMQLEAMPLTSNGKADRKSLPEFEVKISDEFIEASSEIQIKLAEIWAKVLGIDKSGISVTADFFELGGHSIKIVQAVTEMKKLFNLDFPVQDFFRNPKIIELEKCILLKSKEQFAPIQKAEIKDYYRTTSAEARMYFLQQLDKSSAAYNTFNAFEINEILDLSKVDSAFVELVARHSILRTKFDLKDEQLVQIVEPHLDFSIEHFKSSEEKINEVADIFIRPFDLNKAPLFRVGIIEIGNNKSILMLDMHHIISDNVTVRLLKEEFLQLYAGNESSKNQLQYIDYSEWYNSAEQYLRRQEQKEFWVDKLSGDIPLLTLPYDYPRPKIKNFEGGCVEFRLNEDETSKLKQFGTQHGITSYMAILGVFGLVLSKLSSNDDVIIGSPIEARTHSDTHDILGLFVNTLAMRLNPDPGKTVAKYIKEVKQTAVEAFNNQECPIEEIIEALHLKRDLGRNPIFDVVLNMFTLEQSLKDTGNGSSANIGSSRALFDLVLTGIDRGEVIDFYFEYSSKLFKKETIETFIAYFKNALNVVSNDSEKLLSDVEILSDRQKEKLLVDFNDTELPFEGDKLMHQLFEERVKLCPTKLAIESNGVGYTNTWLNSKSNQLANVLRGKGILKEGSVAVIMDRSIELMVALFAILKSGGKYIPIEPYIPENRKAAILDSVGVTCIITNKTYQSTVIGLTTEVASVKHVICLDIDEEDNKLLQAFDAISKSPSLIDLNDYSDSDLPYVNTSNDLAYVIFTSGSSGQPKGVAVQHKPAINLIEWVNNTYHVGENDKILLVSSVSFDLSVYDIFGGLAAGAIIRIANRTELEDPETLAEIIVNEGITFWDSAPAMLQQVLPFLENNRGQIIEKGKLRLSFSSGDWIPLTMPTQMKSLFKDYQFIALGGATEATIWSNFFEVDEVDPLWNSIPYGKPIQNAKYLVLDKGRKLCPIGVPGDLYIGGQCLANGYINDKELSDAKFINSPFYEGEMLYDTGDMARWFPDGNIEFLGRKDSQVKIRGYRIELGEIESKLLEHESISQVLAHVVAKSKYDKYICGYYVAKEELADDVLRNFLMDELPTYMVPKYFVHLDRIPVTKNGKVDRKSLPEPKILSDSKTIKIAETTTERKLVGIWSALLHLDEEKIGVQDDFFELGGQSILAVHLGNSIQKEFKVNVKLKTIFENATIEKQASLIESEQNEQITIIPKVEDREHYPATPAQRRLFYEQSLKKDNVAYNVSSIFQIIGAIDIERLEQAFKSLIQRHEGLRSNFILSGDGVNQTIKQEIDFKLQKLEQTEGYTIEKSFSDFVQPFDLSDDHLIRTALFNTNDGQQFLFVDIHHIICDGISLNILMNDFKNIYLGNELKELDLRFVDYAVWLSDSQSVNENQKEYWRKQLSGELPVLELPALQDSETVDIHPAAVEVLSISGDTYEKIKKFTSDSNVSDFMFLLSIYNLLLSKMTGETDIIIGTDVVGRTQNQLINVVGTFINLLPLRLQVEGEISYKAFLEEVKSCVLNAFDNQDFQFDEMMTMLNNENPVRVHFAFANYLDSKVELDEIDFKPFETAGNRTTQYEFKIEVIEKPGGFDALFIYSEALYDADTMKLLTEYFNNILLEVLNDPSIMIGSIEMEASLSGTES